MSVNIDGTNVHSFKEKPQGDGSWINGGFFALEPSVIDLIENDDTTWEAEPLRLLASEGELSAYKHNGFWRPMDTLRDKNQLEKMWRRVKHHGRFGSNSHEKNWSPERISER